MAEERVPSESSHDTLSPALLTQVPVQLFKRTQAQLELLRRLSAVLACPSANSPTPSNTSGQDSSAHETVPETRTVEAQTAQPDPVTASGDDVSAETSQDIAAPKVAGISDTKTTSQPASDDARLHATTDLLSEEDLPLASYDSLSASQVVPRLALMSESELLLIQQYERDNRHRQTILNRCQQLLDEV